MWGYNERTTRWITFYLYSSAAFAFPAKLKQNQVLVIVITPSTGHIFPFQRGGAIYILGNLDHT
jgi:hypothetical protein